MRKNKYGKEIELLAPAGSYEKAIIAFKYGADAIYIGTPKISLRTKAKIEQEDLEKNTFKNKDLGVKSILSFIF